MCVQRQRSIYLLKYNTVNKTLAVSLEACEGMPSLTIVITKEKSYHRPMFNGKTLTKCLSAAVFAGFIFASGVAAQQFTPSTQNFSPIRLNQQPLPNLPSLIPTDVTPIGLGRERELLRPGKTFYLLQKLPSRMWINGSVEVSQRGETNVFFTNSNRKADYVFRALPNLSVGYRILPRTSLYTNYFVLKDVFADNGRLSYPTTQSLAWGVRHEIPIRNRTNLQFDLQARELWQASHFRQFDFLPGVTLTHVLNPNTIAFGNIQLQLRGKNYFQAPTREIDPFYTLGILHKRGPYTFSFVDTFVCNFRNGNAIPSQGNLAMISQIEASREVSKKIPGLVTFVRAEPIFNWNSRGVPGISGFDFRIFGGLRYSFNKAATSVAVDQLRKQLQKSETPAEEKPVEAPTLPENQPQPDSSSSEAKQESSDTNNDTNTNTDTSTNKNLNP
jgi:hypothetical protein